MRNEFMAMIGRDEDWFIAYCPEILKSVGNLSDRDASRLESSLRDWLDLH
jgi:hypothetical protein